MTFRPSVVPDRGNDIISTFTRSFESARNLVRQDQADKRARVLFEQETRSREQDIEDREFEAAVRGGQAGTFDPGRFTGTRPGVVGGQDIAAALSGREPLDERNIFEGQVPDQGPTEGQPRLLPGRGGAPSIENIFEQAGQGPTTALARPTLIPGVGGAPDIATPPEFGAGGAQVITEPSQEEQLEPGFLPAGDLPEDAVRLPGGRMFSASLRRQRLREEEGEDILAVGEAEGRTPAGQRDAAAELREIDEFNNMTPAERKLLQGQADAFTRAFPEEMADINPANVIERVRFGEILENRERLIEQNRGLGSTAGRQREQAILRNMRDQMNAAGISDFSTGEAGEDQRARFRANAERFVDASGEFEPDRAVTTGEVSRAADLEGMTQQQIDSITSEATSIIEEIFENTRSLRGIQEDLELRPRREIRLLEPLILEEITARWNDPENPWSDPANRPGVGFTVSGGRRGGDIFAEARSPQDILDQILNPIR